MGNVIQKFDNIGEQFRLNFGRSKRLKTSLGGFCTIFSLLTVIVASIIFIRNFLSDDNAEVSVSEEFDPTFPKINLYDAKMSPIITLFKNQDAINPVNISRYITIQALLIENTFDPNNLEEFKTLNIPLAFIPYIPCSQLDKSNVWYHKSDLEIPKKFGDLYGLCPFVNNTEEFFAKGDPVSPPMRFLMIRILPCSLPDLSECASPEEIYQMVIYLFLPQFSFDRKNFKNPVQMNPVVALTLPLNFATARRKEIFLKVNEIYDDTKDFFPVKKNTEFVQIDTTTDSQFPRVGLQAHCTLEQIATLQCINYIEMRYQVSGKIKKITRNYKKLLSVAGEIGGVSKTFFFVSGITLILFGKYILKKKRSKKIKKTLNMNIDQAKDLLRENNGISSEDFFAALKEFEADNHDGFRLIGNSNKISILGDILFEDFHLKLIPLLCLNKILNNNSRKNRNKFEEEEEEEEKEEEELTLKEALLKLETSNPDDAIRQKINQFFLDNLKGNRNEILGQKKLIISKSIIKRKYSKEQNNNQDEEQSSSNKNRKNDDKNKLIFKKKKKKKSKNRNYGNSEKKIFNETENINVKRNQDDDNVNRDEWELDFGS